MAKLFLIISAICVLDESTFPTRAPRNARFDQKTTYLVAYRSDIHWRLYYRLSGLHCSIDLNAQQHPTLMDCVLPQPKHPRTSSSDSLDRERHPPDCA